MVLDHDGAATVMLPPWFERLNRDVRYQLTAIGAAAPELHIADELADSRFRIAGGRPGLKVCWQLTGIRQDVWAQAFPLVVEEAKPADLCGAYLHPGLTDDRQGPSIGWGAHDDITRRLVEHRSPRLDDQGRVGGASTTGPDPATTTDHS